MGIIGLVGLVGAGTIAEVLDNNGDWALGSKRRHAPHISSRVLYGF